MSTPKPFTLLIPEAAIAELRERLARTRWPDEPPLPPWSTGTSVAYLRELIDYWRTGFDWRQANADCHRAKGRRHGAIASSGTLRRSGCETVRLSAPR